MSMLKKTYNSFRFALNGLRITWREEQSFSIEVIVSTAVVLCLYFFHFTLIESAFCVLALAVVMAVEIINTVVEDLCNKIEPNLDPVIGKIKDVSASAVLISVIGTGIAIALVFYSHFT